jgi:hypothetical protein
MGNLFCDRWNASVDPGQVKFRSSPRRGQRQLGVRWDAEKKSLDVAQKGVNLRAFSGIKACDQRGQGAQIRVLKPG